MIMKKFDHFRALLESHVKITIIKLEMTFMTLRKKFLFKLKKPAAEKVFRYLRYTAKKLSSLYSSLS